MLALIMPLQRRQLKKALDGSNAPKSRSAFKNARLTTCSNDKSELGFVIASNERASTARENVEPDRDVNLTLPGASVR